PHVVNSSNDQMRGQLKVAPHCAVESVSEKLEDQSRKLVASGAKVKNRISLEHQPLFLFPILFQFLLRLIDRLTGVVISARDLMIQEEANVPSIFVACREVPVPLSANCAPRTALPPASV